MRHSAPLFLPRVSSRSVSDVGKWMAVFGSDGVQGTVVNTEAQGAVRFRHKENGRAVWGPGGVDFPCSKEVAPMIAGCASSRRTTLPNGL